MVSIRLAQDEHLPPLPPTFEHAMGRSSRAPVLSEALPTADGFWEEGRQYSL